MSSARFNFEEQLKNLYKLCRYLRLIHFKFDSSKQKFVECPYNSVLSLIAYNVLKYVHAFIILKEVILIFVVHQSFLYQPLDAVKSQDNFLLSTSMALPIASTFIFASNFLRLKDMLLPLLNEFLRIFVHVNHLIKIGICFDASLQKLLVLKICFAVINFEDEVLMIIFMQPCNLLAPYAHFMRTLTVLSYVYSHLVLISFYSTLVEYIEKHTGEMSYSELKTCIRKSILISMRIHRLKGRLDVFYSAVLIVTFGRLLSDVQRMYQLVKVIFYAKYFIQLQSIALRLTCARINFPICIGACFDMYLLSHLSETLKMLEKKFHQNLMDLILNRSRVMDGVVCNKKITTLLFQSFIFRLDTLAFRSINFNKGMTFDFMVNGVIMYAVTCLQYYASKTFYSEADVMLGEKET